MAKLEGWVTPTAATKYADHTFVYCPNYGFYFNCWGGGDIHGPSAVKNCEGDNGQAYIRANCYRCPVLGLPDTAGIGAYGINGVCHQSSNCFLYAAGTTLRIVNGRPRGLVQSVGAFGTYGAPYEFAYVETHTTGFSNASAVRQARALWWKW